MMLRSEVSKRQSVNSVSQYEFIGLFSQSVILVVDCYRKNIGRLQENKNIVRLQEAE